MQYLEHYVFKFDEYLQDFNYRFWIKRSILHLFSGYALVQIPDFILGIYGNLRNRISRHVQRVPSSNHEIPSIRQNQSSFCPNEEEEGERHLSISEKVLMDERWIKMKEGMDEANQELIKKLFGEMESRLDRRIKIFEELVKNR